MTNDRIGRIVGFRISISGLNEPRELIFDFADGSSEVLENPTELEIRFMADLARRGH